MELRRSRRLLVVSLVFGVGGIVVLAIGGEGLSARRIGISVLGILVSLFFLVGELRPFRFSYSAGGLDVRHRGLNGHYPWSEIDEIVLTQQGEDDPRLLLVPSHSSRITDGLTEMHPADGRPARLLLDTSDVTASPDEIAQSLAVAVGPGGGEGRARFHDLRGARLPETGAPDFAIVLRGYAPHQVNDLIKAARLTAASSDEVRRAALQARLSAPTFTIALRGYDRAQVDAYLPRLAAQLSGRAG